MSSSIHQVLLNGVDRTPYCLGWEAEQAITYGTRSARVEFTSDVSPSIGEEIELKGNYGGTLYTVFKGMITKVSKSLGGKVVVCDALDYTYWLFFRLIFGKAYLNKKAHEIVQDLISSYVSGITTNGVYTGFTRTYDRTFDKLTVFEAIRQLAEAEDADFWVTWAKDLYFKPRSLASQASVSLSQGTNILEASLERSDDRLINWLRFLGGVGYKPLDQDSWTENSGWATEEAGASIEYDTSTKVKGAYSVKHKWFRDDALSRVYYPASKDLGLIVGSYYTKLYVSLRREVDLAELRIELHKDASNYVYENLTISVANTWEQKALDVGVGSPGWTTVGSFDWATDPVNYIAIAWRVSSSVSDTLASQPTSTGTSTIAIGGYWGQRNLTLGPCVIKAIRMYCGSTGADAQATGRIRRESDGAILATFGTITITSSVGWYGSGGSLVLESPLAIRALFESVSSNSIYAYNTSDGLGGYWNASTGDNTAKDATIQVLGIGLHSLWIDGLYFYTPQIQVDSEDASSQASYKRRDSFKSDDTVSDAVYAKALADSIISLYKDPYDRLRVTAVFLPCLEAGQLIAVTITDFGISSQNFRILALRHRIPEAVTELDLCPVLPLSLEEALARLRRELSDVIRRTA